MSRVCRTAIEQLKEEGIEVGMIRPQTLFPFPENEITKASSKETCKKVLSVEMSMGQMLEDVERSVKGNCPVEWYGKCGGDVPTPEEVMEAYLGQKNIDRLRQKRIKAVKETKNVSNLKKESAKPIEKKEEPRTKTNIDHWLRSR